MERFKILVLTVAVCAQAMSQDSTTESPVQISKPKITVNPDHGVLYNTESVTLSCEISEGPPGLQYDWYKDSKDLGQHQRSITVNENGKYECKGKRRETRSEKSDVYTLTLKALPKPQIQSAWTEAFTGEEVSLQCLIPNDSENWTYMWFRGSDKIVSGAESNMKGNSLTLSVQSSHDGEYVCQAELHHRKVTTEKSAPHSLTVKALPKPQIQSEWTEAFTGEEVSLQCLIPNDSENWTYMWFRAQTRLSPVLNQT
ncbi:Fc receptor-like protein 3 [Puntigrus tetrazona]|uniref:Fc receptor-like protein 3 n=1 Tax=Puntigrus tetrazona TaxID=1606681 RepID=UPI001C8AE33B|nr:Fc receptor-like protein 3 [Puntigrus tetrazona]